MENYEKYRNKIFYEFCGLIIVALGIGFLVGAGLSSYFNW